jgi:hypothetical protein
MVGKGTKPHLQTFSYAEEWEDKEKEPCTFSVVAEVHEQDSARGGHDNIPMASMEDVTIEGDDDAIKEMETAV